ncbi:MAG: hypothetical protein AB1585_11070 [Thermodesulfobacteriota bacterium]
MGKGGITHGFGVRTFKDNSKIVYEYRSLPLKLDPTGDAYIIYEGTAELIRGTLRFDGIKGSESFKGKQLAGGKQVVECIHTYTVPEKPASTETKKITSTMDFSYNGQPVFFISNPGDCTPIAKASPYQVWAVKTAWNFDVSAAVRSIEEGIELKDVNEKVWKQGLERVLGGIAIKILKNEEITLSDGTKAYYSEMAWNRGGTPITTLIVSVYRDGKWVLVAAHPSNNFEAARKIVKSLRFK